MSEVTLEFLARQMGGILDEFGAMRDGMAVVMSGLDRVDVTCRGTSEEVRAAVDEVRAMHRRHDRLARRLDRVEAEPR